MAVCESCGFDLESDTHKRGIGLHGHISTSKEEADEQRAEVFARAQAFSDNLAKSAGRARGAVVAELEAAQARIAELEAEEPLDVQLAAALALLKKHGLIE